MGKCMVCECEMTEKKKDGVDDAKLCIDCWFDFRYGKYPDNWYKDFKAVDKEYNRLGM